MEGRVFQAEEMACSNRLSRLLEEGGKTRVARIESARDRVKGLK